MNRDDAVALDRDDPLAPLRDLFDLPDGTIYLDGNSLGALPRTTAGRVAEVVTQEWGRGLIESWNTASWITLPQRVGDKIARVVGAGQGEVVVADSTSLNVYKVLASALSIAAADAPERRVVISERSNFPTDLYIASSLCRERGYELVLVDSPDEIEGLLDRAAVLMLTEVNYRTGYLHPMAAVTALAHERGVLAVWDLCHSAGAVPVDLRGADADFAIGCGYKFLNGGPGAPAFLWVNPRHVDRFSQPLSGWMGHAAPFEMSPGYRPAEGVSRYLSGTPGVIAISALECGVDTLLAAEAYGGLEALREKSLGLTRLFADVVSSRLPAFRIESPLDDARRGSQLSLSIGEGAYAIVQALIERGVVGDFRAGPEDGSAPDILRFGVTPLYTRYVDIWDAVDHLVAVMDDDEWRAERFWTRGAVT
ncbi:kynureninase [Nocardioides luteus]|uniref:Kynureninase n=1 Tax=Nocardioides luteus TaxID=1844 RepID=A0ABQ5T585_9ACTN|nr:kynureninase [Nocardioides luteus]MDR7309553.1 kynureninase [Nocardioides luteus]GGR52028.1 kynureninase [Nocardioides luteus]GLJ70664.1 kynureninase [Nocardioides luteus]